MTKNENLNKIDEVTLNFDKMLDTNKYDEAVKLLYTEHTSRTAEALEKAALRRTLTLDDMNVYLQRAQLTVDQKSSTQLPLLHVTGTKGKGSTACISECILRKCYKYHTGLFTSPHLLNIRERIRLDGKPVCSDEFSNAYFVLRERLLNYNVNQDQQLNSDNNLPLLPGYFRMLTLMAIYIFQTHIFPPSDNDESIGNHDDTDYINDSKNKVQIMIMEVGMGGRYDATNLFPKTIPSTIPFVCGVTLIDYDHTRILGSTLEKIAWEKGGIFKHSISEPNSITPRYQNQKLRRFFTIATNKPSVIQVLQQCCMETYHSYPNNINNDNHPSQELLNEHKEEKLSELSLEIIEKNKNIPNHWEIGLKGEHQRLNAELALALCQSIHDQIAMNQKGDCNKIEKEQLLKHALQQTFWPGRCQTVPIPDFEHSMLYCDGAHTIESMKECVKWLRFVTRCKEGDMEKERILIFNCSHERNPVPLLNFLFTISTDNENSSSNKNKNDHKLFFSKVFFCPSDSERPSMVKKPSAIDLLKEAMEYNYLLRYVQSQNNENLQMTVTWQDTLASIWSAMQSHHLYDQNRTAALSHNSLSLQSSVVANKKVKEVLKLIHDSQHKNEATSLRSKQKEKQPIERQICVTGSLYIVGSALDAIEWQEESAFPSYSSLEKT